MLTERDYRAVFEASPDAMLIVDAEGTIRDLNPQAVAMFGWSREEVEGSPVERLVPAASRAQHEQHRRHYGEAPRARPMGQGLELLALRRDGSTIPVEISLSPGRLASGREHVICTVRDITGWKRMRQLSRTMVTAVEHEGGEVDGQYLFKVGQLGGRSHGRVQHDCVDIYGWPDSQTNYAIRCQNVANYPRYGGDSGAPIFHGSNEKLFGAHVGRIGDAGTSSEDDLEGLVFYSPIANIEEDLGVMNTEGDEHLAWSVPTHVHRAVVDEEGDQPR